MLIIELTLNPMSTPLINNPDKARVTVGVVYTLVSRGDSSQKALRAVALFSATPVTLAAGRCLRAAQAICSLV